MSHSAGFASTRGMLLLVEDDLSLLEVYAETLRGAGYRVLTARNGSEAFEAAEGCQFRVDLVISDLVMPRMSGGTFVDIIQSLCPEMKILIISGHETDAKGAAKSGAFLRKPFSVKQLVTKVDHLIGPAAN